MTTNQMRSAVRTLPTLAFLFYTAALAGSPPSTAPATKPSQDPTTDWLLNQAATAPAQQPPATQAANPFSANADADKDKTLGLRRGAITTSDGEKITGKISTTLGKPVRLWDDQKNEYRDVPFALIKSVDARVVWERDEPEWHFKESGSDIKEFTGKTYPDRELQYTITLTNGQTVTGGIVAPLYLEMPKGDPKVFIFHKRDKGEVGQTLKQLVYVQHVEFPDD